MACGSLCSCCCRVWLTPAGRELCPWQPSCLAPHTPGPGAASGQPPPWLHAAAAAPKTRLRPALPGLAQRSVHSMHSSTALPAACAPVSVKAKAYFQSPLPGGAGAPAHTSSRPRPAAVGRASHRPPFWCHDWLLFQRRESPGRRYFVWHSSPCTARGFRAFKNLTNPAPCQVPGTDAAKTFPPLF